MGRKRIIGMLTFVLGIGLVFLVGFNQVSYAWEASIWDNGIPGWTTTFSEGDPIDTNSPNNASSTQLAIDSNGIVYVTYSQSDGTKNHIYLSRYDGTNVHIWNNTTGWTTTFA
jgi:uncharacterized membrane protein